MTASGYAFFDTTLGRCAIAWGPAGVAGLQLPEAREGATRARMAKRFPVAQEATPPRPVQRAIDDIVALLSGRRVDLAHVALDLSGVPDFHRRVYEAARAIPAGATLTYGELATRLGATGSARAVGQALGRNPFAIVVPCHRVLAKGGRLGGFSANGGAATKARMLALEGASQDQPSLFQGETSLGYDRDVAVAHLRAADAKLAALMDAVGPCRMATRETSSIFAALAEAIVYQQLSGKAAATILGRVRALFPAGPSGFSPGRLLRQPEQALRGAGLSGPKILALRDLAAKTEARAIPTLSEASRLADEALIEKLTEVRGIGRWTVEMLLMFRLGRPDVLPVDDLGIRKGFGIAFGKRSMPEPAAVARHGARWAPYRTVASWYLWRANELPSVRRREA